MPVSAMKIRHGDEGSDLDQRMSALLADLASIDNDQSETKTFFSTLTNNRELQRDLFHVFNLENNDSVITINTLNLLTQWRQHLKKNHAHLVLQYLPVILSHSLRLRRRLSTDGVGRRLVQALEAFLLNLHNQETEKWSSKSAADQTFFAANINNSSVFHDGSKLSTDFGEEVTLTRLPQFKKSLNFRKSGAANRQIVAESMYRLYNSGLGDYSKLALEHLVKSSQRMLQNEPKIHLGPEILMELLHCAYFTVYNGFHASGGQVIELVRQRALRLASPQLLLAVNAVRTLILTSGPTQAPAAATISTPNQIAKNLITNASFRAKKISDDIVKVQNQEQTVSKDDPMSSNLKVLASMTSINEDVVEDLLATDKATVRISHSHHGWESKLTPRDKLMVKLSNPVIGFKKKSFSSEAEEKSGKGDSKKMDRKKKDEGGGLELKHLTKNAADLGQRNSRKKAKNPPSPIPTAAKSLAAAAAPDAGGDSAAALLVSPGGSGGYCNPHMTEALNLAPSSLVSNATRDISPSRLNSLVSDAATRDISPSRLDSREQVEALIQRSGLPVETITIHSPESGTTLF